MTHHIQPPPPPTPAPAPPGDDDPSYAGSGLFCPRCRITIATTIPLRCCPRCGKRLPGVPADPDEEPLEALDEKIQQTRFAARGWFGWNWPGFAFGISAGLSAAMAYLDWWSPDPLRKHQTIVEFYAWSLFLGGLIGCAAGVIVTGIGLPVWLAVFDSKRFLREYGSPGGIPQKDTRTKPTS